MLACRLVRVTTITCEMSAPTTVPDPVRNFLRSLGAAELPHPGGTLLEHLERVRRTLVEWGADEAVQLAGLCHAVYGTAGFDSSLVPPDDRARLAEIVGVQSEALVYLYASCDREVVHPSVATDRPLRFRDRFTGDQRLLARADARALLELTAANEFDVVHHSPELAVKHGADLRRLFERAADLLSSAARRAWALEAEAPRPLATVTITRLDHLVLTVADVGRSIEFYARVLGMRPIEFGDGRRALTFGDSKINLHRAGAEHPPHAAQPTPGSGDLCFVTASTADQVLRHLAACGVTIEEGPVRRTGALGPMLSCYLRDPDGNLVEISTYDTHTPAP
jgi:catechol 2,3-dioxygenase-like lactoylglutathione lyase family enzyme